MGEMDMEVYPLPDHCGLPPSAADIVYDSRRFLIPGYQSSNISLADFKLKRGTSRHLFFHTLT